MGSNQQNKQQHAQSSVDENHAAATSNNGSTGSSKRKDEGCTNISQKGGLQCSHEDKTCEHEGYEGCTKKAKNRGVCARHGADNFALAVGSGSSTDRNSGEKNSPDQSVMSYDYDSDEEKQHSSPARKMGGQTRRELPTDAVTTLKAWFLEHFTHPYPTPQDKIILMQETGMDEKQLDNWFINARLGKAESSNLVGVPEFLCHLHSMVNDPSYSDLISWNVPTSDEDTTSGGGKAGVGKVVIHDPTRLQNEVLGKYYRHSKYSSFQRQLNYFGFKKRMHNTKKGKMSPCK